MSISKKHPFHHQVMEALPAASNFAVTSSASGKRVLLVSLADSTENVVEAPPKRIKLQPMPPLKVNIGDADDESPRDVGADEILFPIWHLTDLVTDNDLMDEDDAWLLEYFLS
ncbi:hypothetical protein SPRG_17905 [Saprolegnia parasitica CBS 223.65]|uniref:Uncharacterized protein n=1 Tax=Saprolegnia parasitica (strain CBS 223.65) TaxID=695850 RepID=A0A067BEN1_SAPPC|nr:hypothetical protein SPRG_17905 [Saprolegnia parasitica CBS 223.65]KDO16583.1 hypothetical protein SPRG_17905 [Saprolegnia parasitica CBS 223.65]|eukprot:XP_012212710.1 hypothetical protein SPRG_17905 [Saprolegnia parasitica CBS 223.65]